MEVFNNTTNVVKDDLEKRIKKGSKLSIAAACFSIYAYSALKKQLESCEELRFIFTSPAFVPDNTRHSSREFYIPRLKREKSLYGTEFEVRLRNELKQKAVARECAEWIRKKVRFKSNNTNESMNNFFVVDDKSESYVYLPINGFTTVDIGCERGNNLTNMVTRMENPATMEFLRIFNSVWNNEDKLTDVTEQVIEMISTVYQENSPERIYFMTLYNIFNEFLEDISDDVLPNEATGFKESVVWKKLFSFQKDAVLAIINKLEQFNGCILADSVGLGKTFTALAVIKYYEGRNKNVLVLCPKKLSENWMTYRGNLINNPLAADRLRYDVLYHTDLSRDSGNTAIGGLPIEFINWGNYDLVVIDESHNFRNGNGTNSKGGEKENRYMRLMNRIIKPGVKTKVLMLSATPVNNRFYDLRNQLALAYEGDSSEWNEMLNTKSDIDTIFRQAQRVYNAWCNLPEEQRTTDELLSQLDFDFFEVLDSVTIARSRKHIQTYYDITDIGTFPTRNKPISLRPKLTNLPNAINYREIFELLSKLKLSIYTPTLFIHSSKLHKYLTEKETQKFRYGREFGIQRLMKINLLKRMESSVHSFLLTVQRICNYLSETSSIIEQFKTYGIGNLDEMTDLTGVSDDFDYDDQNTDFFSVGKKVRIDLRDMDYTRWKREIDEDIENLKLLMHMVEDITPQYDCKLNELIRVIREKAAAPINSGNKKVLIFTAFSDTAEYLYENIGSFALKGLGLHTALVTGNVDGRTTIPNFKANMDHVLACFSPISKDRAIRYPNDKTDIDILIATDCISEGQNLQDCDFCINYDIHWNPVRIIQRFGRIDRIGSQNSVIQLVNFWPDIDLDEYINLKSRVETRMRISIMTSTGDDDLINQDEKGDLEYRRAQLKRLQEEIVDLEDMTSGISIMDLGLNEFRMDLLAYMKEHRDIDHTPFGIHAVVKGDKPGVIFVLKNVNEQINIQDRNRLHPFYLVYVGEDGEVITNHLQPKETLDIMRQLARGKTEPIKDLCSRFNKATNDGRNMAKVSQLLEDSIMSIIDAKDESDIDSFFGSGQTTFLSGGFSGLDDFELICFMVVYN